MGTPLSLARLCQVAAGRPWRHAAPGCSTCARATHQLPVSAGVPAMAWHWAVQLAQACTSRKQAVHLRSAPLCLQAGKELNSLTDCRQQSLAGRSEGAHERAQVCRGQVREQGLLKRAGRALHQVKQCGVLEDWPALLPSLSRFPRLLLLVWQRLLLLLLLPLGWPPS